MRAITTSGRTARRPADIVIVIVVAAPGEGISPNDVIKCVDDAARIAVGSRAANELNVRLQ
jgi:hypothetical protein